MTLGIIEKKRTILTSFHHMSDRSRGLLCFSGRNRVFQTYRRRHKVMEREQGSICSADESRYTRVSRSRDVAVLILLYWPRHLVASAERGLSAATS